MERDSGTDGGAVFNQLFTGSPRRQALTLQKPKMNSILVRNVLLDTLDYKQKLLRQWILILSKQFLLLNRII